MTLLDALLFFLPAGLANIAPVFANKVPVLNRWQTPIDFGKSWHGKRVFGSNKTWRGLVSGTLIGALAGALLYLIYPAFLGRVSNEQFSVVSMALGGGLLGLGALLGDALESFFKRRSQVDPGDSWFPFDQLDYIIGGLALSYPVFYPHAKTAMLVIALYFGLHLLFSYLGYLLGLKDKPV